MKNTKEIIKLILLIRKKLDVLNYYWSSKINKYNLKGKNSSNPVTILDLKAEKLIRKYIEKSYPNHSIYGEELRPKIKDKTIYSWIIDPIDGTKNLIMGFSHWSNLIGFNINNKPVIGFANFPILKKFYLAYDAKTYVFDNKLRSKKLFTNQKRTRVNKAKIAINTFNTVKNKKIFNFFKNFDGIFKITNADAYNSCLIAEGKIDLYIETGLKKVDILPLIPIIENSGGVITDWRGKKNFLSGDIIVSANKVLHKNFLKKLKQK